VKKLTLAVAAVTASLSAPACTGDREVEQSFVVRANLEEPNAQSLWVVEGEDCTGERVPAGWYRDGVWIFRLSTTLGGIGVVTQELAVCTSEPSGPPNLLWHTIQGGGEPVLVLSCVLEDEDPCLLHNRGSTEGMWWGDDGLRPGEPSPVKRATPFRG
jgi:hypothetical protein